MGMGNDKKMGDKIKRGKMRGAEEESEWMASMSHISGCHRQLAVPSSRAPLIPFHRHELGAGTVGTVGTLKAPGSNLALKQQWLPFEQHPFEASFVTR